MAYAKKMFGIGRVVTQTIIPQPVPLEPGVAKVRILECIRARTEPSFRSLRGRRAQIRWLPSCVLRRGRAKVEGSSDIDEAMGRLFGKQASNPSAPEVVARRDLDCR